MRQKLAGLDNRQVEGYLCSLQSDGDVELSDLYRMLEACKADKAVFNAEIETFRQLEKHLAPGLLPMAAARSGGVVEMVDQMADLEVQQIKRNLEDRLERYAGELAAINSEIEKARADIRSFLVEVVDFIKRETTAFEKRVELLEEERSF